MLIEVSMHEFLDSKCRYDLYLFQVYYVLSKIKNKFSI